MAMLSNISSKYQDLISKSSLISAGRPKIYQLRPKKEQFGTLTRMTVGERDVGRANKTVLLVGETGAGKSALVNALFNYSMGVKWEEGVWFRIVEEKEDSDQNQTSDVIVYQIFTGTALPYSLTIIDTPGFGDTGGVEKDNIIRDRLLDLFRSEDGVHEVHAVGLVMKSTECRLDDRLLYVFNSVTSLFGKDIERNIVSLLTFSDGRTPKNALTALKEAKIKCALNEPNQPTHFLFNNTQKEERKREEESHLEFAWKITERGMDQFRSFLEETPPQRLDQTVNVLNERVRLTACIQNLQDQMELIELKQKEIQQRKEAVEKHEEELKRNERFEYEVDEPYKEIEPINYWWRFFFFFFFMYSGATNCNTCKETCHFPGCTVAWFASWCAVMNGGRCTVCTGKCPASHHVKGQWRYVTKMRRVQKTDMEMKEKYKRNKSEKEKGSKLLQNLKEEENKMMKKKWRLLDEAYQHVDRLDKLALNVNSVSTYVHYNFLIENMKQRGDQEKVQRLEKMKRRVDKGTQRAVGYVWGKQRGVTGLFK